MAIWRRRRPWKLGEDGDVEVLNQTSVDVPKIGLSSNLHRVEEFTKGKSVPVETFESRLSVCGVHGRSLREGLCVLVDEEVVVVELMGVAERSEKKGDGFWGRRHGC
ncbi:hypothetical protein LWI29_011787 [Acer saccharum]|uniref:Uncharacterized protein n=1 Tax=Acer saccharum TaxID=4024 RepID=A0AA39S6R6_ACESA|nr:hypothetical protein LWI29_011787 [Acer saccharum]